MAQVQNKIKNSLNSENGSKDEKPPILSSWKNIYFLVLLSLAVVIIFLYFFSEAFQ